jgi:hypothetical protein
LKCKYVTIFRILSTYPMNWGPICQLSATDKLDGTITQ